MPITDIICKEELQNFNQHGFAWSQYANNQFLAEHEDYAEFLNINELPETLTRENVIDYFVVGAYYEGFVTAMMWGGINAKRPLKGAAGDYTTTNFYRALKMGKEHIEQVAQGIEMLLRKEDIEGAYAYMSEEGRIHGVGSSYFTKLFYFIARALEVREGMQFSGGLPLIYDKWTKWIHITLLNDLNLNYNENVLDAYYSPNSVNKIFNANPPLISSLNGQEAAAYMDYNSRMRELAELFGISSCRLEAYLFGMGLRGRYRLPENNPRVRLIQYLRSQIN